MRCRIMCKSARKRNPTLIFATVAKLFTHEGTCMGAPSTTTIFEIKSTQSAPLFFSPARKSEGHREAVCGWFCFFCNESTPNARGRTHKALQTHWHHTTRALRPEIRSEDGNGQQQHNTDHRKFWLTNLFYFIHLTFLSLSQNSPCTTHEQIKRPFFSIVNLLPPVNASMETRAATVWRNYQQRESTREEQRES